MGRTFRDGDCLFVEAVTFDGLQPGDVVAYREDEKSVAHRIAGRRLAGWVTQGDRNRVPDRRALSVDRLIGKVIEYERNGVRYPVAGGTAGLRRARRLHICARGHSALSFCFAPLYRLLRASCVAHLFWKPEFVHLRLAGRDGGLLKFLYRGRTVARWYPADQRWLCRKPYDLVLTPPDAARFLGDHRRS